MKNYNIDLLLLSQFLSLLKKGLASQHLTLFFSFAIYQLKQDKRISHCKRTKK